MKIVTIKNGIYVRSEADNDSMCSLYSILSEHGFPIELKDDIEKDILNKEHNEYHFNYSGFKIIDQDTLELMCLPDSEKYRLRISVGSFWKAIYSYEKIMEKEWHKIIITYDGTKCILRSNDSN